MLKRAVHLFVLSFFLTVPACVSASSVSIFMCQKNSDVEALRASTLMIESGILETLFDRGHIVSSGEPAVFDSDIQEAAQKALKSSAEGFFEFMVQINVTYKDKMPENPAKIVFDDIENVDWRIVRVRNNRDIQEKRNIIPAKFENENDTQALRRFAQELGYAVANVIQGIR
ncbi:hypothetical protein V1L52_04620 [Treponema sp. HNW]|uniref:hypothetical protein n=1 Tax=Treponema sp. HNW TaxID=3116654 RepID=UPI003D0D3434